MSVQATSESATPLGALAARGAAVTMVGQVAKFGIQFGGIAILARLLDPESFGLVAMVTAVVGVGEVLRDFGLSSAAVQAKSLTNGQRSNLFWINTSIGAFLAVVVLCCAPLISSLYDEPRVGEVARLLAVTFLINGLSTQFRAHLTRQMKFGKLAIADVAAQSGGLLVGITLAVAGFGYWAIVWQQISQSLLTLLLTVVFCRWLPGLPTRAADMRVLLSFGWNLMGTQLLQYLSKNIDSVLVGNRFGAASLGYYNRATQVVNGPLNQLNVPATTVAIPVLSRLQDDRPRYDRFILRGQTALMTVVVAGFLFLASQAEPFVEVLLGAGWTQSADLFRLIAIGAAFQGAGYATYWVFLSKGLTRSMLRYAIVARVLSISLLVVGSFFGVLGVAAGFALGVALTWPLGLAWISRISNAPVKLMFVNGARTLLVYAVSALCGFLVTDRMGGTALLHIGLGALTMVLCAGILAATVPSYRADLRSLGGIVALVRSRRQSPA
ncbi:lipopolysaccharide biosynthesis protein [Prescottella soli]|uniref:Lipopolysaccharide biosynthesis protein n=1 Tax=Prescottella soli TaxID=1543852 RepID=A0ABW9FZN9_9NOCA